MRKRCLNAGDLPRLYYWRDNSKLEIDLIGVDSERAEIVYAGNAELMSNGIKAVPWFRM